MYKSIFLAMFSLLLGAIAWADGTETLGPPSIAISDGTGIVINGKGLAEGPGDLTITVPAGVSVNQVLLYWGGEFVDVDDSEIEVNGVPVTGTLIGGPTLFFSNVSVTVYRADITGLGLVGPGPNVLAMSGLNYDADNHGAGAMVIFSAPDATDAAIDIRDGSDLAFTFFAPPLDTTVPQVYDFAASPDDRTAAFAVFAGSVGGADRPNAIEFTVDGDVTTIVNPLGSFAGDLWDALVLPVNIPAGATSLTAQALSQSDGSSNLPASFNWIAATLAIPGEEFPLACRMTGGGANEDGSWNGAWGEGKTGTNFYTFGGQIGAPTARQPQPFGEWTHTQHKGPAGQFTFHMGTASAPPQTEIDFVECSDPGFCRQARPAPAKQLDWTGVGSFKNVIKSTPALANVVPGQTLHWASGHVEDLGEPGRSGKQNPPGPQCPVDGNAGQIADCDCPDYYRLEIHATEDPASPIIYRVHGYIRSGNIQIHPEIK